MFIPEDKTKYFQSAFVLGKIINRFLFLFKMPANERGGEEDCLEEGEEGEAVVSELSGAEYVPVSKSPYHQDCFNSEDGGDEGADNGVTQDVSPMSGEYEPFKGVIIEKNY